LFTALRRRLSDRTLACRCPAGDEFHHGNPGIDPRGLPPKGSKAEGHLVPDLHIGSIKVKTRDFK
jgi:hypothetical protein